MLTVEEKVTGIQARLDGLETIFGRFLIETGSAMLRLERAIERMEKQAAQDRNEWNKRWGEIQEQGTQDRNEWNKRWSEIQEQAIQERSEWNQRLAETQEQATQDRNEWHSRWNEFEKQATKEQSEWNKRWGELANRLGTIAEDIVAPNLPRIAHEQFGMDEIEDVMVRRTVRHKIDRTKQHEFDVIVASADKVIINETKATPRLDYIDDFIQTLADVDGYFPEYKDRTIIPVFASLYLADHIIKYLTRRNIYAMAMGAETMTLVNFDQIQAAAGQSA